jgi:hypothetical protein
LRTLLRSTPDSADELRGILQDVLTPLVAGPRSQNTGDITQTANVSGGGFSVQAGGDAHVDIR